MQKIYKACVVSIKVTWQHSMTDAYLGRPYIEFLLSRAHPKHGKVSSLLRQVVVACG